MLLMLVLSASLSAVPAGADTKDDLARARARLAAAQDAADAAAGRYEEALAEHARLERELEETQQRIEAAEVREAVLEEVVEQIALRAYLGGGEPAVGAVLFAGDDILDLERSTRLLDRANAPKLDAIDELAAVRDDLETNRARVTAAEDESDQLVAELDTEARRVQEQLRTAEATRRDIETRYAREQAAIAAARQAAAAAAAQRAAAAAAAQQAAAAAQPPPAPTPCTAARPAAQNPPPVAPPPGTNPPSPPTRPPPPPPPVSSNIVCPIRGAVSFVDSWGAARSGGRRHQGVDLMAASGTPNVAVVSGSVAQRQGALQGNGVFLSGDDGNSYWYFHLSSYEGGPRRVGQGEVIGYTGTTGNAEGGAPHTHFEYHPGGGAAVNPYPLVRAAC
jgi:peptidoglycan LD-endopeptidase LytH